jgi:deazaflavin-dependent oxidoreductase (nitroreductase family)
MPDQKEFNLQVIEEVRANRSKGQPDNRPRLLLTTTGARTGRQHTTPMMYVRDGDKLMVIASNAGAPKHPDWYYNLVAHPEVTVELGAEVFEATAVVTTGAERQKLWDKIVDMHPFFGDHQSKVSRLIPVVLLNRREG